MTLRRLPWRDSYFNPRPPRGGRLIVWLGLVIDERISIHAPREGDDCGARRCPPRYHISIHAPREGDDRMDIPLLCLCQLFQSTPPARGTTPTRPAAPSMPRNFNPRPPRGGRRGGPGPEFGACPISIHAPREGDDSKDAQFYLRIFDKQVELLRFLGKIRGWLPEKPGERPAFSREKPCEPPGNLWSLGLRGGGKARPGYPCAVPRPRRAACVRGSGDPPADRCSSCRNAPLFSHIASPDSKSADCLSQNP